MPDLETPPAEPSPAASTESKPEPVSIPVDAEAYAEWRQTGKLPDDKPSKREAAATSKKSVDEESSEKDAPVSETGKPGRENAESRIRKLVSERDSFKARLEALEAGKSDAKAASSPAPAKDAKAESSPAPEAKRPTRPKQEDFDNWQAYQTAEDKYLEDLADYKAAQRLEEHVQKQRQEAATKEMQQRLDAASERYGKESEATITDTAKTIFSDDKVAPALKAAIGRSAVIVDALYVMGSDAEELSEFLNLAKSDPLEALRKWFTVEALVKEELKSGKPASGTTPERGPDGKFLPEKPEKPARKTAPAPPTELNGNSSPPGDPSERAANTGNFSAFRETRNRQDLARQRGQ